MKFEREKEMNDWLTEYPKTPNILDDIKNIIETSQRRAYQAVDTLLVQRNWLIGYRIAQEELSGEDRAEYGAQIIKKLSRELTAKYGKGFDRSNLYKCLQFYKAFPAIVDTVCRQSRRGFSWSHYRFLLQEQDPDARAWYEREAAEQAWSVRTLQRNINTQYYYRMLKSPKPSKVQNENQKILVQLQKKCQQDKPPVGEKE